MRFKISTALVIILSILVVAQSGMLAYLFISDHSQGEDISNSLSQIQKERRDSIIRSCISDSNANQSIQSFVKRLAPNLSKAVEQTFPVLKLEECTKRADERVNQTP